MKPRLFLLLLTELCAVMMLLWSCAIPKVPSAASWDTEFSLPISARVYRLSDVADGDSVLQAEGSGIGMTLPDSALFFTYTKELEAIHPGDHLKLDAMSHEIDRPLQALRIPVDFTQTHDASLASLNPAVAAQNGAVSDVPSFPFTVLMDAPLNGDFSLACADSGQLDIHIHSSLPYPVSGADIVWMADRDTPVQLYSGVIESGRDTFYSTPLQGKCLTNAMFLQVSGMAAGGSQVLIDSSQGVTITMSCGEILATTYTGRLPRQETVTDSLYELNQQHEVTQGLISTGHLTISATNLTPFADSVLLVFPNLVSPAGDPATMLRFMNPGESIEEVMDLTDYVFRPNDGTQQVRSRLKSISLATADDITYVAGDQKVLATFNTDELRFHRFDGVLHNLQADITRDSTELDQPPEGWENIHPASMDMRLTVNSAVPTTGTLQMSMFSTRDGSVIGSADRSADVWLGRDTTVVFSGLEALIPRLPQLIGYSGAIHLEGPVTVYDTSMIHSRIELTAPLQFTLDNTHIPGKANKVESDGIEDIQELGLTLYLWNALPFSGTLRLIAAADSNAVLHNSGMPAETLCVVTLPPAQVAHGRVVAAGDGTAEVQPPASCYDLFKQKVFYIRPDLTLNGSAGDTLAAYGSDYVKFSATARVRYRVSTEK
ncbi:MAG TPA: hypothetical protein VGL38_16060 [bacterium]